MNGNLKEESKDPIYYNIHDELEPTIEATARVAVTASDNLPPPTPKKPPSPYYAFYKHVIIVYLK